MAKGFMDFLKNYGVIGLAIAVIIGGKANAMVSTLVDGILMPVVGAILPGGDWKTASFAIGDITMTWGPFLGALIDFIIVAWLIYMFSKKVLKEETVEKK